MKNRITYIIFICCTIGISGCRSKPALPDMRESYAQKDTKPFGTYIAKQILINSFPDNYVQNVKGPFEKTAAMFDDTAAVYFCVSRNLILTEEDADEILDFVYKGNDAFFSAANMDTLLMNKIFCKVNYDNFTSDHIPGNYQQTSVKLIDIINVEKDSFGYFYKPFLGSFSEVNDRYGRIIGYNATGKTNCIVFFWGKGKLFLHTEPRAFSNYFLLSNNNYKYMQGIMRILTSNPQHIFWDDYYNHVNYRKRDAGNGSSLSELFKYPQLQFAFWLLLLLLLFYILFESKRKQRIIKEIKPNLNSSIAFTETIARLYLQKHDNKNIAEKMITYFYEFIRSNYFINTHTGDLDFAITLSKKSGVAEEKTIALFNAIQHVNNNAVIDDYQLLSLNEQIQQFYKKRI